MHAKRAMFPHIHNQSHFVLAVAIV